MPITVEVPEVGLIDFPDDFSEDQISQALAAEPWKAIASPAPPRALAAPPINPDAPEAPPFAPSPGPEYNPMREIDRASGWINRNVVDPVLQTLSPAGIVGTVEHGIEGIASLATGKDMRFLASPSEALRVPAISPETVKFFSPLGKTQEGTVAKGVEKFASEFISGLTSPEMGFALATAKIFPEIVGRAFQAQMATSIPAASETLWHSIRDRAETPDQVVNALNLLASAGMPVAIEMGLRKHAMREFSNLKIEGKYAERVQPVVEPAKGDIPAVTPEITPAESARVEPVGEPLLTPEQQARVESRLRAAMSQSEVASTTPKREPTLGEKIYQGLVPEQPSQPKPPPPAESEVTMTSGQAGVKNPDYFKPDMEPHVENWNQFTATGNTAHLKQIPTGMWMDFSLAYEHPLPRNVEYLAAPPKPIGPEGQGFRPEGYGSTTAKPAAKEAVAPVAEAKMQAEVSKVAASEGKRSAKDIKADLIEEIQQRLQAAPAEAKPGDKVTIEIPDDGTFTVPNTVEALSGLLERAKKIKTDAGKPTGVPSKAIKQSGEAIRRSSEERIKTEDAARVEAERLAKVEAQRKAIKPFDDPALEKHFQEWLDNIVHREDRAEVSTLIHAFLKNHPEALGRNGWTEIRRMAEKDEISQEIAKSETAHLPEPPTPKYSTGEKVIVGHEGWEREGTIAASGPPGKWFVKTNLGEVAYDEANIRPAQPTRTTTGEGQAAETKLAQIVNEAIEQSTSPTKLGVTPAGSSRPTDVVLGATDLKSVSPRAEARWQESVREKPSLLARLQDTAVNAWHSITREYADLPPREFPEQIDILRRLRASRNASARRTVDVLRGITHNLGPKQYGVFNRVVVLEDLLKDVESGKYADGRELPSGHANAAELTADLNKFKSIAEATPEIAAALERRGEFMNSLRETLVERGFLPETVLQDPRYFHHQVLMYLAAAKSGGAKSFRDWFSGWQKARVGSSKAYNRQYVEAEGEVIADAFNKMTMQDLQGQMKGASDLTAELKQLHGDEWASHVPPNYTRWQPKRGNVFYPVKTVAERVMEEYLDGLRDILPEEFKDAVAIGRKREEWIIPKELAKVLDNLAPRKDTWIERLAGAGIGAWKRYILLNPLRAMKYQVNNTSGDVDFVFAANPRIFKEFKQAAIDSYAFHKKGKAATGDVKEAIDLGVVQSGWRASEIPDIGGSEYFNWLTGSKPGVVDRYWKWISKWNDAREDTARLATYRFALKEWNANKPFYGASAPKDVAALPTNKLKAAKVARELLIDYGRETEFGEFMRRKAVPFYRWMHGNFARYVQLTRNIPVQEGAGAGRLAALGAKKGAVKAGALAARGAVAYMAINLWNNLFFPDEEEALGDTRNQLHLILGRDEQGNIQTIRFQGALSDLLGWVGLENLPQDLEDLFKGKASLGDKMEEGFEAGVSRAVNATSPFYKTAAEAMTGRSLYPNAFEPRPIRDKAEHVAGLFSLKNVYQWLAGKPHKPLRQELTGLLAYTVDPGEAAYNATRHMAAEWLEDRGEERSQTIPGKRANALYYYKQALRYKDPKLAAKFKAEYEAMGGKQEGLTQSIARSAPLASLGKKQNEFLQSLSPAERAVVDRAQKWYQQVYR